MILNTFLNSINKERQYLYKLCRIYLFETPASFPRQAVNSLKTVTDRATDIFNKFKEPIAEIIKKISKAKGVEVDLSKIELDKKIQMSHRDNFYNLRSLLERVGINTIYVLVDKVDEQSLTGNDPKASYTFISPLLKDLELLETPGVAFKFFLWDELRFYCSKDARPDRVFSFQLNWSVHQMKKMLNKRLSAYSSGYIIKAEQLFRDKKSYGRVIVFSEFSPRDCIRICNRILSEHIKENNGENVFGPGVVNRSIDMFCREKVQESIFNEGNLRHLAKVDAVSFTIEELVSKKVGADNPAVRNIINPWTKAELAKKIGLVKRLKKKAVNEYAFSDVRFARYACPTMDLDEFVKKKIRRCSEPACKKITYRDFDKKNYACPECNTILV